MTYLGTETIVKDNQRIRRDVYYNDKTDEIVYITVKVEDLRKEE